VGTEPQLTHGVAAFYFPVIGLSERTRRLGVVTTGYSAAGWTAYSAAAVGAGASLSGFVFVTVSINLDRILRHPSLPARAWQTLGLLVTPVVIGFFLLIPGQPSAVLAWELIATAGVFACYRVAIDRRSVRSEKVTPLPVVGRYSGLVSAVAPALAVYACLAVAGATLLAQGGGGLYWVVPSVVVALLLGVINAWALLVDIPH
jgi:modulator of FtsH protease